MTGRRNKDGGRRSETKRDRGRETESDRGSEHRSKRHHRSPSRERRSSRDAKVRHKDADMRRSSRDHSLDRHRDPSQAERKNVDRSRVRDRDRRGSRTDRRSRESPQRTKGDKRDSASHSSENEPRRLDNVSTVVPSVVDPVHEPSMHHEPSISSQPTAISGEKESAKARLDEAEEKIRQRRERIEQWRKEKALKDIVDSETSNNQLSATLSGESHQVKPQWSLEDDDEDEAEIPNPLDVKATEEFKFPEFKPSSRKAADNKLTIPSSPVTRPVFKKSTKFGAISIKPSASVKTFQQNGSFSTKSVFGEDDELLAKKPAATMPDARPVTKNDIDPLEAFMDTIKKVQVSDNGHLNSESVNQVLPLGFESDEDDPSNELLFSSPDDLIAAAAAKIAAKRKEIAVVDHSSIVYDAFRKDFYVEPPEVSQMTPEEVEEKRIEMDGIKIRGARCPKPIEKWTQFGLPPAVLEVIRKVLKYEKPSPIQSQGIPAIMNGRDVIGIAKTGSGKTIAFLLPMFRHIKDQRPLEPNEGPISIIMTPTRELAVQIHRECKPFAKLLNIRSVCCYGGAPIKDQIAELKRGAEVVICTPGRMIDLLCANNGRVTNLKRATYLVLDEADRMFDMGFEPQVMKVVNNIRPDRQTVLFSATFPKKMEALARKILVKPIEITVGGRSVVCGDVKQIVEVRDEDSKFVRLLEILGLSFTKYPDAKILIFVDRQEASDTMLGQLLKRGYPCATLHGGKDQADRDSTVADFKSGDTNILIATSVAARGLDVKQLKVVINYECPNHMEDYVHRVGRTGRAGQKGEAYTFVTPDQDKYAVDIIKALTLSNVEVPPELDEMANQFMEKIKSGTANYSSSGFGGKGLEKLDKERDILKKIQKRSHGLGDAEEEEDEEATREKIEKTFDDNVQAGAPEAIETPIPEPVNPTIKAASLAGLAKAQQLAASFKPNVPVAAPTTARSTARPATGPPVAPFSFEIEINDYPQKARWKVTNKEQISQISEMSGAAITTRGSFYAPGTPLPPGKRKLYLYIEGGSQLVIDKAKLEIRRIITEATIQSMESDAMGSRYSVL